MAKCRKDHQCRLCGETIHAGETCERWSGLHEGEYFTSHAHPECLAETEDWDLTDWETCSVGDVERPKKGGA
jgi:hypothetical protein